MLTVHRPEIDWSLALGVTERLQGELPEATRPQARQIVSQLRRTALRAGELAARRSRLDGAPAARIAVVDRLGWARGAATMAENLIAGLGFDEPSAGVRRRVSRTVYGLGGGVALAVASRALLGQYDAFSARPTLHLIAPNLVSMARRMPGSDEEFYLWVAAHEQTHALQFNSAEWLNDYALGLFRSVATDEVRGTALALLQEDRNPYLERLRAMMTFLEGHADLISDSLGIAHVRQVKALRRRFLAMRRTSPRWQRLIPAANKNEQYRLGIEFCTAVRRRVGLRGLNQVFSSPEALPEMAELRDPSTWLARIHGTS